MYNTKVFTEKGWPTPTSWNDLKDPKFKKLLVIPPINNTYGLYTLMMFARMNGGGEKSIEPGFKVMKDEVNANVLAYEPSPGKMTELFQSGQAVLAVWGSGRVQSFANTGFPVDFVYPKEGAPTCSRRPVRSTRPTPQPLASEFIKAMLGAVAAAGPAQGLRLRPRQQDGAGAGGAGSMAPLGERAAKLDQPRLGHHQRPARGLDQALEPRGRALMGRKASFPRRREPTQVHGRMRRLPQ